MTKNNLYIILLIILLIIFDFLLIFNNYQLLGKSGVFVIDNTINTLSFISLLVTFFISILVPFFIKKVIDDNKGIKLLIIDEVKQLISLVEKNHKIVTKLYSESEIISINKSHRDKVRKNFYDPELKLDSLKLQLDVSYPSKNKLLTQINADYTKYKQFLSDGKFMISSYKKIDFDFYMQEKNAFAEFQKNLMVRIHEIHKF